MGRTMYLSLTGYLESLVASRRTTAAHISARMPAISLLAPPPPVPPLVPLGPLRALHGPSPSLWSDPEGGPPPCWGLLPPCVLWVGRPNLVFVRAGSWLVRSGGGGHWVEPELPLVLVSLALIWGKRSSSRLSLRLGEHAWEWGREWAQEWAWEGVREEARVVRRDLMTSFFNSPTPSLIPSSISLMPVNMLSPYFSTLCYIATTAAASAVVSPLSYAVAASFSSQVARRSSISCSACVAAFLAYSSRLRSSPTSWQSSLT